MPKPVWWKNTFFWFGAILLILGIIGFIGGDKTIRDPGQIEENGLPMIYLGGAALMLFNGWMSHRQAVQLYTEHTED